MDISFSREEVRKGVCRTSSLLGMVMLAVLGPSPVYASGDVNDCQLMLNLTHAYPKICSNVPFLSPANDTRTNLILLLADHDGLRLKPLVKTQADSVAAVVPFHRQDWSIGMAGAQPNENPGAEQADGGEGGEYAFGEGSRCRSNQEGAQLFSAALADAKSLPPAEKTLLDTERQQLPSDLCHADSTPWKVPAAIKSSLGRQFASYIAGADAFYRGDYHRAKQAFGDIVDSEDPWLKDTSRYMQARIRLIEAADLRLGEYGEQKEPSPESQEAAMDAARDFKDYLAAYPDGRYANSARGLLRRAYWLAGDQRQLAAAFQDAFLQPQRINVSLADVVQEADRTLFREAGAEKSVAPELLAVIDLMRMRPPAWFEGREQPLKPLTLEELRAQRALFQQGQHAQAALHDYLLAAYQFYVAGNPKQVLQSLSDAPPQKPLGYLAFSQQSLRGFALEATGQNEEARSLWLRLMPMAKGPLQRVQLELALAINYERAGLVDQVFAGDSPIKDPAVRAALLYVTAGPDLLRRQALADTTPVSEREIAWYALLSKELTRGRYEDFLADMKMLPNNAGERLKPFRWKGEARKSEYACPSLIAVARALQQDPKDGRASNCLGEWARTHGFSYEPTAVSSQDGRALAALADVRWSGTTLAQTPSLFPGKPYSRLDGYMAVIENPSAQDDAHAYALYRAVRCFEPGGNNDCGVQNIPGATRKRWFQMLKARHADSRWAKTLKYYW